MSSTPGPHTDLQTLAPVPGQLPDLRRGNLPACRFAERCERADEHCRTVMPTLDATLDHAVACWHPLGEDVHMTATARTGDAGGAPHAAD
jgi:oligopeptide/dipeptide ABC transporter ATP-binding protein